MAVLLLAARPARAENDWYLSLYGGQFIGSGDGDLVDFRLRDAYLIGAGLTKEFARFPRQVGWELECQLAQHFGEQAHLELDFAINARWLTFPWDAQLDTSLAFGSGLSYTTDVPETEAEVNPDTGSTRLLHYLLVEVAAALPESRWGLFTRLHHRSGIWGFFDGVGRASNYIVLGIRYRF
jgi:hypothetical protein